MTSRELRRLPRLDLAELYASLRADRLPVGTYDGRTWPVPVWPFWRGKVFTANPFTQNPWVINRIGPFLCVEGTVCKLPTETLILYPFGLEDYLKPVSDTLWLGYMMLGPFRVWFTLERKD